MKKIAILISGHLRNFNDIIDNFNENFIKPISEKFIYDIYLHTWDNNYTYDKVMNNDNNFMDIKITKEYINNLFNNNNIFIKKIIIENQEQIKKKINLEEYLNNNTKNKSINNNFNKEYVKDLINKLFFQFYGHYILLNNLDLKYEYDFIIKTRPDMFYEKINLNLLKYNIFFPNSHQHDGYNINQLFFGGKTEYMLNILNFFDHIIFHDKNMNNKLINEYHKSDINFNRLFRYYIFNILKYQPFFTDFNPKIYRSKNKLITIK